VSTLIDILPAHRFDEAHLHAYLNGRVPGLRRMRIRQLQGGQSNPTFLLEGEGGRFVLRKKPPGTLLPSAHQVEREFRVISALYGSDVPVPRPLLLCEDPEIIGTAFYVMEYVEGRVFERAALDGFDAAERAAIYDNMNKTLAALHRVDWVAAGLQDFGRHENYLRRQVDRWSKQYRAAVVGNPDPIVDEVIAWLQAHLPVEQTPCIAHGDYRLGNLIYANDSPRVAAVLDWELSTLGDPLSDLAYCCLAYHLPSDLEGSRGLQGLDLAALGIPDEKAFVAKYCERTGRSVIPHWGFYMTFALFRLTAIVQGVYARAVQGNASDANAIQMGSRVQVYARAAHVVASTAGG
jgi:aminoglycoside phosphotransferase (APT) family kinase protein